MHSTFFERQHGCVTSRHDLQQEINSKVLALGYVPILY
jgi:hypothetical protein